MGGMCNLKGNSVIHAGDVKVRVVARCAETNTVGIVEPTFGSGAVGESSLLPLCNEIYRNPKKLRMARTITTAPTSQTMFMTSSLLCMRRDKHQAHALHRYLSLWHFSCRPT